MAWARLDDNFHDHPKVLGLSVEAVGLYTLCLTWAHRNTRRADIPGVIPANLPTRFAGPKANRLASELVSAGMWEQQPTGWLIHDFGDYLPDEKTRSARSKAGSKGARKRWHTDSNLPSGSHDDATDLPEESITNDGSRADARREVLRTSPTPDGTNVPPVPDRPSDDPSAATATHKRDPVWDALMAVCQIDTSQIPKSARGAYNGAVRDLRAMGATPQQIAERGAAYRSAWPAMSLTPTALVRRWSEIPANGKRQADDGMWDRAMARAQARDGAA